MDEATTKYLKTRVDNLTLWRIEDEITHKDWLLAEAERQLPYFMTEFAQRVMNDKCHNTLEAATAYIEEYRLNVQLAKHAAIARDMERMDRPYANSEREAEETCSIRRERI